jgi:hypothetical protein
LALPGSTNKRDNNYEKDDHFSGNRDIKSFGDSTKRTEALLIRTPDELIKGPDTSEEIRSIKRNKKAAFKIIQIRTECSQ